MSMKKLAIALSIFALAGSVTFAKAPIISGIPDITIGDNEDRTGASLTIDNNWFRFNNAFDIRNYVTDVDSASTDWLFAFFEQTTTNAVGVRIDGTGATARTITQINAADAARPANWGTKEITNLGGAGPRDYLISFVDLVRSPEPYGSTPYPNPAGAPDLTTVTLPWPNTEGSGALSGTSRLVWFYAADDSSAGASGPEPTRVTSEAVNIISKNYANDSLQNGVTSAFGSNFVNGAGTTGNAVNWTFSQLAGWTVCTSGASSGTANVANGNLTIAGASAETHGFGRWETRNNLNVNEGAIPYVNPGAGNLIYCARFTMSQNQSVLGSAPQIRFGVFQAQFLNIIQGTILPIQNGGVNDANANPQVPAAGALQTYKVVWSAMEGSPDFNTLNHTSSAPVADLRTYNAYFDILDQFAGQGGTWTLYNFDVVTAPRPASVTPALSFTNFAASAGWTVDLSAGTSITGSVAASGSLAGSITFNDTGSPTGSPIAYYMWRRTLDKTLVHWTDNQLLRFTVALSCPVSLDRQNFHWFRVRQNTAQFNVGNEWSLFGDDGALRTLLGGNPYIPPATPAAPFTYDVYMASQVEGAPPDNWVFARAANGDVINLALDAIAYDKLGASGTTHQLATHVTVHSVNVEVLADNL